MWTFNVYKTTYATKIKKKYFGAMKNDDEDDDDADADDDDDDDVNGR